MTSVRENRARARARLASFGLEDTLQDKLAPQAVLPAPIPYSDTLHVLTSLDEVRTATETIFGCGQRLISIMTPDLEPELYDQPLLLETLKHFVLSRSFAKVRVLLRDQARLSAGDNHFVAMARRLTSYLEIRIRGPQHSELHSAYCIADDRAILYRLRADRWDGIATFNNIPVARQYLAEFDRVWLASADEHDRATAPLSTARHR